MCKFVGRKKGLTLIEVVISLAILVIVVPPILSMILSSVKTNKRAENEQQALYVAQQCIEDIKSKSTKNIIAYLENNKDGKCEKEIENFKIQETIIPDSNYYFLDSKSKDDGNGERKKIDFKDIKYDGKIVIKDNGEICVYEKDKDIEKKSYDIERFKENEIEIINGKNLERKQDSKKILININNNYITIDKDDDKNSCFIIETEINIDSSSPNKFNINAYNYCGEDSNSFDLYLVKNKGINFQYSFSNNLGKVKFYSNLYKDVSESKENIGKTRLYKISVKVWEKGQNVSSDKPIKEINAYKTALE